MTDAAACTGCCLDQRFLTEYVRVRERPVAMFDGDSIKLVGLTMEEKSVLNLLGLAWNEFSAIKDKHPQEDTEFLDAIHRLQHLIGYRVARRVDKEVWTQYE
jgi:hypothetical protein